MGLGAHLRGAIKPAVRVPVQVKERLQDVQHAGHLREDEASVPTTLALVQQLGQPLQLATVPLQQAAVRERNLRQQRSSTQRDKWHGNSA